MCGLRRTQAALHQKAAVIAISARLQTPEKSEIGPA